MMNGDAESYPEELTAVFWVNETVLFLFSQCQKMGLMNTKTKVTMYGNLSTSYLLAILYRTFDVRIEVHQMRIYGFNLHCKLLTVYVLR